VRALVSKPSSMHVVPVWQVFRLLPAGSQVRTTMVMGGSTSVPSRGSHSPSADSAGAADPTRRK
jgi:hypothetical protein